MNTSCLKTRQDKDEKIVELLEKILELSEKVKLLEVQLVARQDKGLKHSDLRNNQTGNLLTGSIKKVRYWSGKHSEKART